MTRVGEWRQYFSEEMQNHSIKKKDEMLLAWPNANHQRMIDGDEETN